MSKKRKNIPSALRQQVWMFFIGKHFESKCGILWCTNQINVFSFHVGHDIPDSKGGSLLIDNLLPICSNCNLSMSNKYSIFEWNLLAVNNNNKLNFFKRIVYYLISYIS